MEQRAYQVRIAGSDVVPDTLTARLHEPLPAGAVMHIVPRLAGAKSGWAGVLLGAALIGASLIPGLNALAATVLFSSGTSMALGGVAQMLAPQAKSPAMHSAD
ncbi:tail assembly protein, partial [Salmonella enterica]|nr:tail assembly protein [Salmonella enterica]EJI4782641.1 tail assembly protein [Salmonella enterica]